MKLKFKYILLLFAVCYTCFAQNELSIKLTMHNPAIISRVDEYLSIKIDEIKEKHKGFSEESFIVLENEKQIAYQIVLNEQGEKLISFVVDFKPKEKKVITIKYGKEIKNINFPNRTYAELAMKEDYQLIDGKYTGGHFQRVNKVSVPLTHKDHDALFKYEGPGWESELVGYRFYLDWRNTTDIFGKKVKDLVLKDVGVNDLTSTDNDSYHSMQKWGMDIFKVGSSLGIGAIGIWNENKVEKVSKTDSIICQITENGPLKSEVATDYYGWNTGTKKLDLFSRLSITAGSRLTRHEVMLNGGEADNLVTGLAKYESTHFIKSQLKNGWNYIALYGKQSLAKDSLGIAVFFNSENYLEHNEDELSYIVKLKPISNSLAYYFCAAWEKEPGGIRNEKEFIDYLNQTIEKMNNPIIIAK